MIHVAFPLYDPKGTYTKYEAVALLSMLCNTKAEILVHIIHDCSVSYENKSKIRKICDKYNKKILFHELQTTDFEEIGPMAKLFTIGTLFRLKLPDLLEDNISKIIYLDADLLINTDVEQIWNMDIGDNYVAACHDPGLDDYFIRLSDGLVPAEKYFNAGVTVFNLARIRHDFDLFSDCASFLLDHPSCTMADQDAMNYLFMDNVLYLPYQYNIFTRNRRGHNSPLESGIYHFAGDYCNPISNEAFDKLFYHYLYLLQDEQWITEYYIGFLQYNRKQLMTCQSLMKSITERQKKVYWGANSIYSERIVDFVQPNTNQDYIVDSNTTAHGKNAYGMMIHSPQKLFEDNGNECVVIVVSKRHYSAIKNELERHGFVENEDFFDGIALLSLSQGGYGKYY